jgi:uncharacterized protein (TIGR01777 family)
MKVLISGATGLVGAALAHQLRHDGYQVSRLVRPATRQTSGGLARADGDVNWDPGAGTLDPETSGADAVVHLAGASIAGGRWNAKRKMLLYDSRVAATRHLNAALGQLPRPPRIFVAASAIGFYGDRGDEILTESSTPGADFLAKVCCDWEAESKRAAAFGARVVILRFGIILARQGGALPQMATPFRFGAGGRIGSGRQWMSWVALEDVVAIIREAISDDRYEGPVNVVAPQPVQNSGFTSALGCVLHRPAVLPAPAFALRLALGEMAEALLLSSQRVLPQKLEQLGYRFAQPGLSAALEQAIGRVP